MSNLHDAKSPRKTITLNDGIERELKFTLNAMAELEDRYGSVEAAFEKLEQNSIKAARCIIWAGLLHSCPDLTEQQVGDMIDLESMGELMSSMNEALASNMPQEPAAIEAAQQLPNV